MLNISLQKLQQGNITSLVSLTAPISGYIKQVNVNIGKYVTPNEVLFEIVNTDHMHLELKVFESDIFKVKDGQEIRFSVPNLPDTNLRAEVYLVGKVFENESRAINVHGHLEPANSRLIPGMYVNARIMAGTQTVQALPEGAIITEEDKRFIFVNTHQEGERLYFRKVPVQTGISEGGFVEIISSEQAPTAQNVVVKGAYYLQAEMIWEEE
jgi:cobalt-zinc-cadmium efflux system membrane fusion protein